MMTVLSIDRDRSIYTCTSPNGRGQVQYFSVTKYLEPITDMTWTTDYGLERGRMVHKAAALLDKDDLDWDSLHPELIPRVQAWQKWKAEFQFQPLFVEHHVVNHRSRYAGTLDRWGYFTYKGKQRYCIVDLKCGPKVQAVEGVQTAAYEKAFVQQEGHKSVVPILRVSVHLLESGEFRPGIWEDPTDFRVFLACMEVFAWQQRTASKR